MIHVIFSGNLLLGDIFMEMAVQILLDLTDNPGILLYPEGGDFHADLPAGIPIGTLQKAKRSGGAGAVNFIGRFF
jgi:hypothetical protein